MKKHVYIDLGTYDGDTLKDFMKRTDLSVKPEQFEIHCFEPNPDLLKKVIMTIKNYPTASIAFLPWAAWIKDGVLPFAKDTTETPMGSTLMSGKRSIWDTMPHVDVIAFDFPSWVLQFASDYVIVKMDIEGAEYPILENMLLDGTISLIDQLWCEFHPNKVVEYTSDYNSRLIERIRNAGVELIEWH
jgi:FkbM family methyltransferase